MIKIKNVNISFNNRKILDDISLDIESKKIISIIGKSGAGKSTLLGIISGLLKPDSGNIYFNGNDIFKWWDFKRSSFRRKEMGFVFQFFGLFSEMNVYENIIYPITINPFSKKNNLVDLDYLIDLLEIKNILKQSPETLSGGERQRVAIARAVINSPKLILADEPTGNLDDETASDIIKLFTTLKEEKGITIIFVTHDKNLIDISDKVYSISDGKISEETKIEVKTKKKIAATKKKTKPVKKIVSKNKKPAVKSKKPVKKTKKVSMKKKKV